MAKLTKAQRSAAARKGWRTRRASGWTGFRSGARRGRNPLTADEEREIWDAATRIDRELEKTRKGTARYQVLEGKRQVLLNTIGRFAASSIERGYQASSFLQYLNPRRKW